MSASATALGPQLHTFVQPERCSSTAFKAEGFKLHFVSEVITLKYVFIQAHEPLLQPCPGPQRHQWAGLRESVPFGPFLEGLCTPKVHCLEATGSVSQVAS